MNMERSCCDDADSCEPASSKKMKNCMVCGAELTYLSEPTKVICNYCEREEAGYFLCPELHYVCDSCHGKDTINHIKHIALNSKSTDPLEISEKMMALPSIPLIGCEHAAIVAAAFLTVLRNEGTIPISDDQIGEAMNRARTISRSGYCGLAGTCGIACGIASAFSVVLGANCSKDMEFSTVLHIHADVTRIIAGSAGPCCCKRFLRDALAVGQNAAKRYLGIDLSISRGTVICQYSDTHPHCINDRCVYFA